MYRCAGWPGRIMAEPQGMRAMPTSQQRGEKVAIRPLIAGNWKMNGLTKAVSELTTLRQAIEGPLAGLDVAVMVAPPATLISRAADAVAGSRVQIAGQDCHAKAFGAHTGDIAPEMLADAGASAVILGHSERRADHGETSAMVAAKVVAAHRAGLTAIVCVGETQGERAADLTLTVVERQLAGSLPPSCTAENTVIAYEPVWAIGTGLTPTREDVGAVHQAIRASLVKRFAAEGSRMAVLYGGSVKPDNAESLMSIDDVNGALVGGASLKAEDFIAIIQVYDSMK